MVDWGGGGAGWLVRGIESPKSPSLFSPTSRAPASTLLTSIMLCPEEEEERERGGKKSTVWAPHAGKGNMVISLTDPTCQSSQTMKTEQNWDGMAHKSIKFRWMAYRCVATF